MPVSQIEAQKEYLIRNFYDLLQALREHPDWLEELRRIIYTTELYEVPKKLDELIESFEKYKKEEFKPLKESHEKLYEEFRTFRGQEFKPLKEDFETFREKEFKPLKESHEELREEFRTFREKEFKPLKEEFETFREKEFKPLKESHEKLCEEFHNFREKEFKPLKEKVDRIEKDVEILKQDVKYLKVELGDLKGDNFERKVREKFALFFGKLLRKAKVLSQEELLERLSEAEEKELISEEEFDEILRLDVIVEGLLKHSKMPVVLAVEVSVSLYPEDIERASSRAYALSKVLEKEVIPIVVFKKGKPELEEMASEKEVLLIKAPED